MEIDDSEEVLLNERSRLMDEKVKDIGRKNDQQERFFVKQRTDSLEKKKKAVERKVEKEKKMIKNRKQKNKDAKKKINIKKLASNISPPIKVPNIREIPQNCKHLVDKDDVLYTVPGDGCCGPNCGAAFLFNDEVYGPKLRNQMNRFMAKHWYSRYRYITNCSQETPFVRKLRGGEKKFSDPAELVKYLYESEEAAYMWTDCEDLAVLADMYQFRIKVVTTKGSDDVNVSTTWIYPEQTMEKFAELTNVKLDDMALLHENNTHFNLIVNKNSDLSVLGSLSHRFKVGPLDECVETNEEKKEDNEYVNEINSMKKELKKLEKNKVRIETEYFKCEQELKSKTGEVEKLKIEGRDLKEIISLSKEVTEIIADNDSKEENVGNPNGQSVDAKKHSKESEVNYNPWMKSSRRKFNKSKSSNTDSKRKVEEEEDGDFNCFECNFQGRNK